MVERHVFRVAGARPVTARAQDAGDTGESGVVLGVVPIVELVGGHIREIHRRDQHAFRHGRSSSSGNWHIFTPTKPSCASTLMKSDASFVPSPAAASSDRRVCPW